MSDNDVIWSRLSELESFGHQRPEVVKILLSEGLTVNSLKEFALCCLPSNQRQEYCEIASSSF